MSGWLSGPPAAAAPANPSVLEVAAAAASSAAEAAEILEQAALKLAGPTGANDVGAIAPFSAAIARTLGDIESATTLDVAAPRNGTTLANVAFAKLAQECDNGKARWFKLENWKTNYRISAPIVFNNPGVRIFGEQGATYNRNDIKTGWIEAATGTGRIFDLGNSRTTGNPADNWEVDRVSLRQAAGVAARTIDGIAFTSLTDGPDRGANIQSVSFVGLKDAVVIDNASKSTGLATLAIERSVIVGCASIINAKGNLLGFSLRNCQIEQNVGTVDGLIRGSLNGPVTIENNMAEGQGPLLSVDIPPITGNRPHVTFRYNYLEANSGAYVLRLRASSSQATAKIGPNYTFNILAQDYVLFEGGSGAWTLTMEDEEHIVFKNTDARIRYGSKPFFGRVREYAIRQLGAQSPEIVLSEFQNLVDPDGTHTHAAAPAGTTAMTPYGTKNVITGDTFMVVPLACAVGDLVVVNILCRVREVAAGSVIIQVYDQAIATQPAEFGPSGIAVESAGRWALVSRPFRAKTAATSLRVRIYATGTYDRAIAGVSAKNYGAFADDGTSKVLVMPVTPNIA